jgi:hypothetical protein
VRPALGQGLAHSDSDGHVQIAVRVVLTAAKGAKQPCGGESRVVAELVDDLVEEGLP